MCGIRDRLLRQAAAAAAIMAVVAGPASGNEATPVPGEVTVRIPTVGSAEQQYSLFLPSQYSSEQTWPLLIVLDPRGRAVMALELFQAGAERHGFVVMSSYQSRSDTAWAVTTEALKALLEEAAARYSIDSSRTYLAGLSGTSRAAWAYAHVLEGTIAGVIGVAGARPHTLAIDDHEVEFDYFGITGTTDFNHREMVELSLYLDEIGADHRLEIFEGGHHWPGAELASAAVDWMQLQAIRTGEIPVKSDFMDRQLQLSIERCERADETLEKTRRCCEISRDFDGLRDVERYRRQCEELTGSKDYKKALAARRKLFDREKIYVHRRLGPWLVRFRSTEQAPPSVSRSLIDLQIRSLQKQAQSSEDPDAAYMAQRLLDDVYANLSFYLPRDMRRVGDLDRATQSLKIAIEVAPERRRAYWRLAEAYAEQGRQGPAFEALERAIALGRVDLERLKTDPSWEVLRSDPRWLKVLERAERERI